MRSKYMVRCFISVHGIPRQTQKSNPNIRYRLDENENILKNPCTRRFNSVTFLVRNRLNRTAHCGVCKKCKRILSEIIETTLGNIYFNRLLQRGFYSIEFKCHFRTRFLLFFFIFLASQFFRNRHHRHFILPIHHFSLHRSLSSRGPFLYYRLYVCRARSPRRIPKPLDYLFQS